MNEEKLLENTIIINLIEFLEKQSKDSIENLSKIINKKRRELFQENRNCKLGDQSKQIPENLFNLILNNEKNERIKLSFILMYHLGLRVSEVVEITTNDIIKNKLTIHNIKSRKIETRIIPISIRKLLEEYIEKNLETINKCKNHLIYDEKKEDKLSKDIIRNKFRKNTLDLKINKIYSYSTHNGNKRRLFLYSTHSLRHSFAHRFYDKSNNDIEKTRIAMRHSLLKDTQNYIKGDINEVNKIMEKL